MRTKWNSKQIYLCKLCCHHLLKSPANSQANSVSNEAGVQIGKRTKNVECTDKSASENLAKTLGALSENNARLDTEELPATSSKIVPTRPTVRAQPYPRRIVTRQEEVLKMGTKEENAEFFLCIV